jgi:hypothetical protein
MANQVYPLQWFNGWPLQQSGGVETVANRSARQIFTSIEIIQRLEAIHKMV